MYMYMYNQLNIHIFTYVCIYTYINMCTPTYVHFLFLQVFFSRLV